MVEKLSISIIPKGFSLCKKPPIIYQTHVMLDLIAFVCIIGGSVILFITLLLQWFFRPPKEKKEGQKTR